MSDPNWFYSTLAQSTAAIVGLAGGFLAARLMTQRGEVSADRERLKRRFDNLINGIEFEASNAVEAKNRIEAILLSTEMNPGEAMNLNALPSLRSSYSSPGMDVLDSERREALKEFQRVLDEYGDVFSSLSPQNLAYRLQHRLEMTLPDASDPRQAWLGEYPDEEEKESLDYWADLANQRFYARRRWQDFRLQHMELISPLQAFRARLIPRSTYLVLATLAGLIVIGAVIPMTYLTAQAGSSKTALLIPFTILALAVVAFLFYEVVQVRRAADLSRPTF